MEISLFGIERNIKVIVSKSGTQASIPLQNSNKRHFRKYKELKSIQNEED